MYPHKFGQGKYLSMFDGLHIGKVLLGIHGQLIANSGVPRLLNHSKLSITGAGNIALNVPNITSAGYYIQFFLCAEFKIMMLLFENEETFLDFKKWKMILDFKVLILHFVHSEIERNFNLYVVLNSSIKCIFALNHYNYARWVSLHADDLLKLEFTYSDIYKAFYDGNFCHK